MEQVIINRVKGPSRKFQWAWLYSVQLFGHQPVTIGTSLTAAKNWAKKRRPGAEIVLVWEQK